MRLNEKNIIVKNAVINPEENLKNIEKNERDGKLLEYKNNWEELGINDKISILGGWFFVGIIGNFLQIMGSVISIMNIFVKRPLDIFEYQEITIGFGSMLAWIVFLKYLEFNPSINIMTSTLSNNSLNLFGFTVGIIPFFIGFAILGYKFFI